MYHCEYNAAVFLMCHCEVGWDSFALLGTGLAILYDKIVISNETQQSPKVVIANVVWQSPKLNFVMNETQQSHN